MYGLLLVPSKVVASVGHPIPSIHPDCTSSVSPGSKTNGFARSDNPQLKAFLP
ncbi:MAG TPA: hypothetical protein VKO41_01465 [Gaiellaceae bacterium]|nr:hypothetical protein [Gaiellaceae bacterium]